MVDRTAKCEAIMGTLRIIARVEFAPVWWTESNNGDAADNGGQKAIMGTLRIIARRGVPPPWADRTACVATGDGVGPVGAIADISRSLSLWGGAGARTLYGDPASGHRAPGTPGGSKLIAPVIRGAPKMALLNPNARASRAGGEEGQICTVVCKSSGIAPPLSPRSTVRAAVPTSRRRTSSGSKLILKVVPWSSPANRAVSPVQSCPVTGSSTSKRSISRPLL